MSLYPKPLESGMEIGGRCMCGDPVCRYSDAAMKDRIILEAEEKLAMNAEKQPLQFPPVDKALMLALQMKKIAS